ncbi:MAG: hypothetical protein WDO73_15680 [Ignavibacteriota bacterium]
MPVRFSPSQDVTLKGDGEPQTESIAFNIGDAGPKTLEVSVQPVSGEENQQNNTISRVVNVENRKPKILYFDGEEQWEYKFIRRAVQDYPDLGIELASIDRVTENKLLTQLDLAPSVGRNDLADGFPGKPEELFQFQAVIIGSAEANYFTATQQQLIRDFVDKRGGGLLFTGGRYALSDGGYQSSPMADLMPTRLPANRGTFHRVQTPVETDAAGGAEHDLPPRRRSRQEPRALENHTPARRLPGYRRPQTGRHHTADIATSGQERNSAPGHRELRPRPHRCNGNLRELALEDVGSITRIARTLHSGSS